MKSDTFNMSMLFDFYGDILTDKQKELFDLYYNEDLSLTEIAEHCGISRQGVRDGIMRAEVILRDTEQKLGLMQKYSGIDSAVQEIAQAFAHINTINATQIKNFEIARQLEAVAKQLERLR